MSYGRSLSRFGKEALDRSGKMLLELAKLYALADIKPRTGRKVLDLIPELHIRRLDKQVVTATSR
jgi:hypothetical protein